METFFIENAVLLSALASAAVLAGIVWTGLRRGWYLVSWVGRLLPGSVSPVSNKTIQVVEVPQRPWWHMGSSNSEPAMQVVCHWYVTNLTDRPIRVLAARLLRPETTGMVSTKHPSDNIFGQYPIHPGATTELSADFWIKPPVREKGQEFKATVVLVDQFGNEHRVKNVIFRYS